MILTWPGGGGPGVGTAAFRAAKKPRTIAETEYFIAKVLRRRYEF